MSEEHDEQGMDPRDLATASEHSAEAGGGEPETEAAPGEEAGPRDEEQLLESEEEQDASISVPPDEMGHRYLERATGDEEADPPPREQEQGLVVEEEGT